MAGFSDPAELEPERRPGRSPDLRRLTGLLTQPLAALAGPGYGKPVWHCAVRAAPGDRVLPDAEWAQVAAGILDRTGLAPAGDDLGVRWLAVRHAADHVHIVATLARQDGIRPRVWNDFYRVREACQDAERRFGLTVTAPADRTAARRPARAEAEQSARRGWDEVPRDRLRREVCAAAAGARSEREFFAALGEARVLVRKRYSTLDPGAVTGYAVGLPGHAAKDGGTIWYGGGKLAADLSLPKLRCRWVAPAGRDALFPGHGLPPAAARGVLRAMVTRAAEQAAGEAGFFARLRGDGVLVRLRFIERNPGQVTGYAVGLPDSAGVGGEPVWFGGGRLAAGLSLPRLRHRWGLEHSADADQRGAPEFTAAEREAIFEHAARHAATAAEHIRRCIRDEPARAADAAWAAAGTLHVAARATRSRVLRHAADAYDRAARIPYGRIPGPTRQGNELRAAARLIALTGRCTGDDVLLVTALAGRMAVLVVAVAELREAQRHAAQAAAARAAAEHLHAASARVRSPQPHPGQAVHRAGRTAARREARLDLRPDQGAFPSRVPAEASACWDEDNGWSTVVHHELPGRRVHEGLDVLPDPGDVAAWAVILLAHPELTPSRENLPFREHSVADPAFEARLARYAVGRLPGPLGARCLSVRGGRRRRRGCAVRDGVPGVPRGVLTAEAHRCSG